jgi:hypothetical protein
MKSYLHSIPGRLRLRSERLKADASATAELQSLLRTLPGITTVEFHAYSSSLLVHYDAKTDAGEQIVLILRERGYFDDELKTNQAPDAVAIRPLAGKIGRRKSLSNLLVSNVKHVAVTGVATYLLEAAIIRFAPPVAIPLMLLPLIRRGSPEGSI